jgi:hypothetical protein
MGKVFKKITKPIAKVFDKIIPNEIKPALPYLAAVAPFMLPAGFTIGGLSSQLSRAIASGAINLGSQAAQEGAAERGINPLSLALAAGSGYLSTPGATETLKGAQTVGTSGCRKYFSCRSCCKISWNRFSSATRVFNRFIYVRSG